MSTQSTATKWNEEDKHTLCRIVCIHDKIGWPSRTKLFNEVAALDKRPIRTKESLKRAWRRMGDMNDDEAGTKEEDDSETERNVRPFATCM